MTTGEGSKAQKQLTSELMYDLTADSDRLREAVAYTAQDQKTLLSSCCSLAGHYSVRGQPKAKACKPFSASTFT